MEQITDRTLWEEFTTVVNSSQQSDLIGRKEVRALPEEEPDKMSKAIRKIDRDLWNNQRYPDLLNRGKIPNRRDLAYTVSVLAKCLDETRRHAKQEYYWKATHLMNELSELDLIDWDGGSRESAETRENF